MRRSLDRRGAVAVTPVEAHYGRVQALREVAVAKHVFSAAERYAVFKTHGARCYMCREPVDMASFQVDHVIPESLLDDPERLKHALADLGRLATFEINSFENWLPACGP